ncbi:MAG: hypothetical protein AB8G15_13070 [Saprospiraceae bacterium]
MTPNQESTPAPGWVGGFATSNDAFAYPEPDLNSLPMLGNMDNIGLLQRQQKVMWPEFSWQTVPGDPDSRCYQMFSPDISRLGYTDEGRIYSIICPQQGACSSLLGCMNVEVTVTGNRGWVDETNKTLAADMEVEGTIWFTPSTTRGNPLVKLLWHRFAKKNLSFPFNKANAIKVMTNIPGNPEQPIFPLRKGQTTEFPIPKFAMHPEAWDVAHLGVEIGEIKKTGIEDVDKFNELIMDIFNISSGNMLKTGNTLTWNVWFTAPEIVNTLEWRTHAERWRLSIDTDHGSPTGPGTKPRYFNGKPFKPGAALIKEETDKVLDYMRTHL